MQAKGMPPGDAAFKEHRREQGADGVATSREARTVVKHGTSRDAQWALMRRFADVNVFCHRGDAKLMVDN
jgi:hypothetical protein